MKTGIVSTEAELDQVHFSKTFYLHRPAMKVKRERKYGNKALLRNYNILTVHIIERRLAIPKIKCYVT